MKKFAQYSCFTKDIFSTDIVIIFKQGGEASGSRVRFPVFELASVH